ncbi:hypothetical protein MMC07_007493 [Pseudocyphellaria aurata]|nr:hypothetical protein [Pseudocyphellaria aurata]
MAATATQVDQLPRCTRPLKANFSFTISSDNGSRRGNVHVPGRKTIQTPHYLALSSRGIVSHLSQDTMREHTSITGLYTALEDFIEKAPYQVPPIFGTPASVQSSPLRRFIALQQDTLLVLGPRRSPPLPCPASNTNTAISIATAVGFRMLESIDYVEAVQNLRPDVVLGLADVVIGQRAGPKRTDKMGDRTLAWMKQLVAARVDEALPKMALFAPILPIEPEQQAYYLDDLEEDLREHLSGLFLYHASSILAIPENLSHLPRMSISEPNSPHALLYEISLGIDLFTIPFVCAATDAGIALDFTFPPPEPSTDVKGPRPLGIDMWSPEHGIDLSPLRDACRCYTCTNHHRAYVQHLLSAKEMLAWVLLQLHNHHVMDEFFTGVRRSIDENSFDHDRARFTKSYQPDLPAKTGQGPRIRGYQFKSEGKGEPRRNPVAYRPLVDEAVPSDAPSAKEQDLGQGAFPEQES